MSKLIDLTGQTFGFGTVLGYDSEGRKTHKQGGAAGICQCRCGTIKSIRGTELREGRSKSCGCLQKKNYIGQRFGKLIVLERDAENYQKHICQCDCGNIISVYTSHLIQGATKSCNQGSCKIRDLESIKGQRFGKLIVKERDLSKPQDSYWLCDCDCGTKNKSILKTHLVQGHIISCGCEAFHSQGEIQIKNILIANDIPFIQEYSFPDFYYQTGKHPRYDFYVDNKYLIEYDGKQHFEINTGNKNKDNLLDTQKKDSLKNNYALQHKISLIRIPYYIKNISINDLIPETSRFLVKESEVIECDTP